MTQFQIIGLKDMSPIQNLSCYDFKSLIMTLPGKADWACMPFLLPASDSHSHSWTHSHLGAFKCNFGFMMLALVHKIKLNTYITFFNTSVFVSEWVNEFMSLLLHIVDWSWEVSSNFHTLSFCPMDPTALHVQDPVMLLKHCRMTLPINQSHLTQRCFVFLSTCQ